MLPSKEINSIELWHLIYPHWSSNVIVLVSRNPVLTSLKDSKAVPSSAVSKGAILHAGRGLVKFIRSEHFSGLSYNWRVRRWRHEWILSKNSSPTPLCVPRNRQRRHKLGKGCEKNSPILANEEKTPAVKMADTEGRETGLPKIGQAASVMRWAMKWVAVNYILK